MAAPARCTSSSGLNARTPRLIRATAPRLQQPIDLPHVLRTSMREIAMTTKFAVLGLAAIGGVMLAGTPA
ncbi:hypothetical protein, partial [Salmonella enterica]|uniref:hypothetical protein n=1 Tax=Salmonella enterica TaxID=28901 RepID=UPI001A7E660F